MTKHVGIKLPDDLIAQLKECRMIAILGTFSEKGVPSTTPLQCVYPKGPESLLLTIAKDDESYHNMVWQKKVTLTFLGDNNVAYTILGRAGVVRAPSMVHPLMNVVRIDIIDVISDESALIRIDRGVLWSYTCPEAQELIEGLFGELKELAVKL